jgi:hypothetical protein
VTHPIIYPAMVDALIDWQAAAPGPDRPDAEQVLADLAWRPHGRSGWLPLPHRPGRGPTGAASLTFGRAS